MLDIVSSGGTTTLTDASPRYIRVTGTATHTIVMPDVSTLTLGSGFTIHNLSTGQVTVQSSGLNTIVSPLQNHCYRLRSVATTGTNAATWQSLVDGTTSISGSGNIIGNYRPNIQQLQFVSATGVTAGTNAQGQGALSETFNVITTAASNPSGATLPTAGGFSTTQSRLLVVVNKGANPVNVYPASGGQIDALGTNVAIPLPVNGMLMFFAASATQWYSSVTVPDDLSFATGTLAVGNGGTGATSLTGLIKGNGTSAFTAATAGTDYLAPAAIGSTVQAYDGDLAAIAAISGTSGILKKTAANTWALDTTVLADADIGVAVQAYDADLGAIAALGGTSGFLKKTAANTWALDTTVLTSGGALGTPSSGSLTNCTAVTPAAGTNNTSIATTAFVQTAINSTGTTLLGTITTTGSPASVSSLTLTGYTHLMLVFNNVNTSGGAAAAGTIGSLQVIDGSTSGALTGVMFIDLTSGIGACMTSKGGIQAGATGYTTSSTSITFTRSGSNTGSIRVYGMK